MPIMCNCKLMLILFVTLSLISSCSVYDSNIEDTKRSKDCPLWFHFNSSLQDCQCSRSSMFKCKGQDVSVKSDYLATYDQSRGIVSLSFIKICQFLDYTSSENGTKYSLLPKNISQLNNLTCGPLNRKGYLCRDCIDGYGLTLSSMACTSKCYQCTMNHWQGIAVYVGVEIIPLMLFYAFVLVFRISVISAPMTCFILYSQMITIAIHEMAWQQLRFGQVVYTEAGELRPISKFFLTAYGVFNLDFFCHVLPPFCISTGLTPLQWAYLGYISVFFPLILISLTWFCIKLHDNNLKPSVILWRLFHRCFFHVRKGWNIKSDLIDVFASFLLLSCGKVVYQMVLALHTILNFSYSLQAVYLSESYVFYADHSIEVSSALYIISGTFSLLVFCIFVAIPVLILVLYPFQSFRAVLSKCGLHSLTVAILMEKFHACYRDGLDGGRDLRSFSGLYFLLRVVAISVPHIVYILYRFERWLVRGSFFTIAALVIALCRPYKKILNNISDTLLLFHIAVICYILSTGTKTKFFVPIMQALILIPFVVFSLLVAFKVAYKLHKTHQHWYLCCPKVNEANNNITESEQQQLIQPDY